MFKKDEDKKNNQQNNPQNNPFNGENFDNNEENTTSVNENQAETPKEEKPIENGSEEKLKNELEDLNNKYLRLAADFDNYRKRQTSERENLLKYGAEDTLKKIITVLDTFERAKKSIADMTECQMVKESYEVAVKQLYDTLDKIGLKKIEAKGEEFDPNLHEAVMQTPTKDAAPNTVIDELQTGYKLFDKVLRPTFVNVATEASEEE